VGVHCLEEFRYVYRWFNVTWVPAKGNDKMCGKLKRELQKENVVILGYRCQEVSGWRNWEVGGGRKMEATGGRLLLPRRDLGAMVWKAFGDYNVWYEGRARGERLCRDKNWGSEYTGGRQY